MNSIAAKVYNKMLLHRIQPHIDPILSWTQAGFRKSRSTLSNILALRRIIEGIRLKNIPLTMVFVDFCKAFDSINRDQMFKILEAYGIPNEIINAIKVIYKDNIAAVITPTGLTEFFRVLSGIFQGDTLAPFLFIIVIDYVLRKTYRACPGAGIDLVPRRGSRQPATHLGDLSYADDVTLLSYYRDKAQELLHSLEQAASQVGLLVNADKTKVMSINNSTTPQLVTASNTPLKDSHTFKYLGSLVPDSYKDFKQRKAQAWSAMAKLDRVWKSNISRKCKLHFFQASVESILLYGAETWTFTQEMENRVNGCYTRLLRKALNVRWQDHLTNQELYQNLPKLSTKIRARRLRFAGHCARALDQPVSKCLFWTPQNGHISRGRPRITYTHNLLNDTNQQETNELLTLMQDRESWNDLIDNLPTDEHMINPPTGDR